MTLKPLVQSVWSQDEKTVPFQRSASFGLFVGVSQFGDGTSSPDVPNAIPYAVDDAVDLAWLFCEELGLIDASRVKLMLSGSPTKDASRLQLQGLKQKGAYVGIAEYIKVLTAINNVSKQQTTQVPGLLVVSFATHGLYLDGADGDRILCADSLRSDPKNSTLSVRDIISRMTAAQAGRRLALMDCCRNRPFTNLVRSSQEEEAEQKQRTEELRKALMATSGTAVLSATSIGGVSFDDPAAQNGVFTSRLIAGLRGQAPADASGYITIRSVAEWTDAAVKDWIRKHQPQDFANSGGIGKEYSGANPEDIPLALSVASVLTLAKQRRLQLLARFSEISAKQLGSLGGHPLIQILAGPPLAENEFAAVDQLDRQVQLLGSNPSNEAAELFGLWWDKTGEALFRRSVPPVPDSWLKKYGIYVALCMILISGGVLLKMLIPTSTIHEAGPDLKKSEAIPELKAQPIQSVNQPLLPVQRTVTANSKPDQASVEVRGPGETVYKCGSTQCSLSVLDGGPYSIVVKKRYFKTWKRTVPDLDALEKALHNVTLEYN